MGKKIICCNKNQFLFDYQIKNDLIWMAYTENKKNHVHIIGEYLYPDLSFDLPVRGYVEFAKDCYTNLYLLTKDSAYWCSITKQNHLILENKFSIISYNSEIKILIGCIKNQAILSNDKNGQEISYYKIDSLNSETKLIYHYIDTNHTLEIQERNAEIEVLKSQMNEMQIYDMGDIGIPELYAIRDIKEKENLLNEIIRKNELLCPLIIARDSIYIFNHDKNSILVIDENDKVMREFPIEYDEKNGRNKEIISNDDHSKVYFKFQTSEGLVILREIDLNNGKIVKTIKLKNYPFAYDIKISNNYIYFFYEPIYNNERLLIRENL